MPAKPDNSRLRSAAAPAVSAALGGPLSEAPLLGPGGATRMSMAEGAELLRERAPVSYNAAEQRFSAFVQHRLYGLLKGEDNDFMLIRRYCCDGEQSLAFLLPDHLESADLRPGVAESIISGVIRFLDPFSSGGPIAQRIEGNQLTEMQTFPTHYPHIVVERVDVFDAATQNCVHIEWRAVRLQNQRRSTLVNRALDLGNLALEIARLRGG